MKNKYYDGNLNAVEKVTLAEDIKFTDFNDVEGKFFVDILSPNNDVPSDEARTVNRGKYQKSNYVTLNIPANVLINCIKPKMRTLYVDAEGYVNISNGRPIRVLSMGFNNSGSTGYKIKKGTVFLVEFVSGSTSVKDYRIIGTSLVDSDIEED